MSIQTAVDIQGNSYGYWKPNGKSQGSTFVPVGDAAFVEKITSNIETNEVKLLLRYQYMGETKHLTIDRTAFGDSNLLLSFSGKGVDVRKKTADIFVDSLRIQEAAMLENNIGVHKVYSNLGWINLPVLNNEGIQIGSNLHYRAHTLIGGCVANYDGQYSVKPMGKFDVWKQMVIDEIIHHTPLEIVLLAGLSAVINGLLMGENSIVHVCGCSSSGKSTALYACASSFGAPYDGERRSYSSAGELQIKRSIYSNWSATEAATTRQCVGNKGVAIVLNELGKYREKDLSAIVYDLSDGVEKTRLDQKMKTYTAENYSTTIISSGEISLIDHCKAKTEGIHNRVLEITDVLTTDADHARRIKSVCSRHNGWAGAMLAQYIIDNGGLNLVRSTFQNQQQFVSAHIPNSANVQRFIEKFPALILTTAELASKALAIPFDTAGILDYFVRREETEGTNRNVSANSYECVIEACRSNKTSFYIDGEDDPKVKSFGRISYPNKIWPDGRILVEQYEIRRSFLEEVLSKNNYQNLKTCAREWKTMGVLDYESGRLTRARKIDKATGATEDVFVLRVFADAPTVTIKPVPKSKIIIKDNTSKASRGSKIHDLLGIEESDEEEVVKNA